jgi:hypothetical protein
VLHPYPSVVQLPPFSITVELFEEIMLHLPFKIIVRFTRVDKLWRARIHNGSVQLQKKLFLRASANKTTTESPITTLKILNPMLQHTVTAFSSTYIELHYNLRDTEVLGALQKVAKTKWGDMFITSHAIQQVKYDSWYCDGLEPDEYNSNGSPHGEGQLEVPSGVRIKDVAELMAEKLEKQMVGVLESEKREYGEGVSLGWITLLLDMTRGREADGC